MKKVEEGHRHEFIAKGNPWPEWATFIVGVAGGYECFENEKDQEKWLNHYQKVHEHDEDEVKKPQEKEVEPKDRELPYTGPIGFGVNAA